MTFELRAADVNEDQPGSPVGDDSPMWLQHHHGTERCAVVGGHFVCRRCLALYPTVIVTTLFVHLVVGLTLGAAGVTGPAIGSVPVAPMIWLLVTPMALEWVLEHAGTIAYSAKRQITVSVLAGVGGGLALAVHLLDPFNARATLPIAAVAMTCLLSTLLTAGRRKSLPGDRSEAAASTSAGPLDKDGTSDVHSPAWLVQHESDEAARLERLTGLLSGKDS